jgi:hypothetical protein
MSLTTTKETSMTNDEWEQRLVQSASLQEQGLGCAMCAGTGGWPGLGGGSGLGHWVPCKACNETGQQAAAGAVTEGLSP